MTATATVHQSEECLLRPGNTNCGGCGMSIGLNMLSRAVGDTPIQIVIPACCGIVTPGHFPNSAYGAPVVASTFASSAAVPDGANGMYHPPGGQPESGRYAGLPRGTAIERTAGRQQFGTGCTMDGAIHTAPPEQRLVGGIDDGVRIQAGDVTDDN